MDVQCERCKTEYEFDDALVSGKGTTVKCTNCGFQFKIRKDAPGGDESDRWSVQTQMGERLMFTTLRELQRAILNKQVEKSDLIARGDGPPRLISSIAELAPFFEERRRTNSVPPPMALPPPPPPPAQKARSTPPPPPMQPAPSVARVPTKPPPPVPSMRPRMQTLPGAASVPPPVPARARMNTLRPGDAAAVPPPPVPARPSLGGELKPAPVLSVGTPGASGSRSSGTLRPAQSALASTVGAQPPPTIHPEVSSPLPAPTVPVRRRLSDESETPGEVRAPSSSQVESVLVPTSQAGGRRRVGGWVVAVVLLAGVAVIGWVWAKPYLARTTTTTAAPLDPRAKTFLEEGERALTEGNLELAKENFDKASALAEKDTRVLLDLARLAGAQADVPWLKQRLLAADAAEDQRLAKQSLQELSARAKKAAEDVIAVAPEDGAALRVKIDAMRIAGEREAARALVARIIANATQAETAYVLAALDLAEEEPPTPTVIARLRVAAAGEGNAGRARAALVYALARAGDAAAAKTELEKLAQSPRPHPLLANLRAYVEKSPAKGPITAADAGPVAALSGKPVDVQSLPQASAGAPTGSTAGAAVFVGGDPKRLVPQAEAAYRRGEYDKARGLYSAALDRNPGDSEALAGLADVDKAQGNFAGAKANYKRAIGVNPSYLPALIGLADAEWDSGERGSAQARYKEITDRFPEAAYPPRVKARAEGGGAPAPTPTATPTATSTATSTATPTATPTVTATATATATSTSPGDQGGN